MNYIKYILIRDLVEYDLKNTLIHEIIHIMIINLILIQDIFPSVK